MRIALWKGSLPKSLAMVKIKNNKLRVIKSDKN